MRWTLRVDALRVPVCSYCTSSLFRWDLKACNPHCHSPPPSHGPPARHTLTWNPKDPPMQAFLFPTPIPLHASPMRPPALVYSPLIPPSSCSRRLRYSPPGRCLPTSPTNSLHGFSPQPTEARDGTALWPFPTLTPRILASGGGDSGLTPAHEGRRSGNRAAAHFCLAGSSQRAGDERARAKDSSPRLRGIAAPQDARAPAGALARRCRAGEARRGRGQDEASPSAPQRCTKGGRASRLRRLTCARRDN